MQSKLFVTQETVKEIDSKILGVELEIADRAVKFIYITGKNKRAP